ncbi:I78 family peptidase inhibitor [Sulfitobacter sp. HNIBRBA3233]|uniref:I78 family peptidase inhibitor n=1 Tax=Sulfitobacter marinivivus TaxID=3158558 RepID=UPI0032DEE7B0
MKYSVMMLALLAGCGGAVVQAPAGGTAGAGPDTCGASGFQDLVGRGAAAALVVPEPKRLYRTDEAITQDFVPGRLNVVLDETDTIIAVRCG